MAEQDAEENSTHGKGGAIFEEHPINVYKNPEGLNTLASLPDKVNLSTSNYFPPIREQQMESCVAWAEVYYQFTYEAAKLNHQDAKHDSSKVFSPKYAYTYLSNGLDDGLFMQSCLDFLEEQGAVRWTEFPEDNNSLDWYEGANETVTINALRNALKTKVSKYYSNSFADTDENKPITGNKDSDLNHMKELLNDGHVLTFATDCNVGTTKYNKVLSSDSHKGEHVIIAGEKVNGNMGHAMTIVGYDDTIYYDLNQNGSKEAFEYGAFLIANSWGKDAWGHNNGYIWVMYDALNPTSNASN